MGNKSRLAFISSLRFWILAIVTGFVVAASIAFTQYSLREFETLTELTIRHEGLLLSDTLESGIKELAGKQDIPAIQTYLDQLIEIREKNDIEINIVFLDDATSQVVASNVPDNIEATDDEEHQELLNALNTARPYLFIEREDSIIQLDEMATHSDPAHADYYFPPGYRFISITTPLLVDGKGIGSINVKLSLRFLDDKLAEIYRHIYVALLAGLIILVSVIALFLDVKLFSPLWKLAGNLHQFGLGMPNEKMPVNNPRDEIGILTTEFNGMVERVTFAEEKIKDYQETLEERVKQRTSELMLTQDATILSMGTLAETRDNETGGHIKRTQNYVRALAEKMSQHPKFAEFLDAETITLLYKSAPLHDIGKVGIPDRILLKPGKLTKEEFEQMKTHTTLGRDALLTAEQNLGENSFLRFAREIAYSHQEKWDGSGYPLALQGNDIPVSGRLMAVADVYDALISRRVYKPPFPHAQAVEMIIEGKGKHFDPDMVDAFVEIQEQFREIALQFADHDEERLMLAS